jgi:nucleoside phosphorylase
MILEAPAGQGKTTTLIQLAQQSCNADRLTYLIDLPGWAKSGKHILDFISNMQSFRSRSLDADILSKLCTIKQVSFLLNGWNEVSETDSDEAIVALQQLELDFPTAGIIVATRNHYINPPLSDAFRVKLLPFTRAQRAEYLERSLGARADELGSELDDSPVLDALTRTPLVLSEVTTIFLSGSAIPTTRMGVLGAVMHLLEQSEEHRAYLKLPPLVGHAQDYLAALSIQMTMRDDTRITEKEARAIVNSVTLRLRDDGQIATLPEPASVLNTLCSHHILEIPDYPSDAFRFVHQQFQEFYSALFLKRELWALIQDDNQERRREFTKQYVNSPAWEVPFRMLAEEIGTLDASKPVEDATVKAGKLLIEMALSVDPVFAGELSRLCGNLVWERVRTIVGERLQRWYGVADEHHKQCALAGMLATGSDDFIDIILPLLTSHDKQVRLRTYRAGSDFHLSSLGSEWRNIVKGWTEEARIEFIHELTLHRWRPEIAEAFALADRSLRVRVEAIHALSWAGSDSNIARLLEALDEETFEAAVEKLAVEVIPVSLRPRAVGVYQKLLNKTEDARDRLRILLGAAKLGDTNLEDKLKQELTRLEPARSDAHLSEYIIKPALNFITDQQWVSHWVARRIVDGSLQRETWKSQVTSIPEDLKEKLLEEIDAEDAQQFSISGIASLLPSIGDAALAEKIFSRLCAVQRCISDTLDPQNEAKRKIARQLEDLFRSLQPNVAVAGLSTCFAGGYDPVEFTAIIEVFSRTSDQDADLRSQLRDDLRANLRTYLKNGLRFALSLDDFRGEMKAHLATALARVGEPGDMHELHELTLAEIERVRDGRAALARGERTALAKGGSVSYTHWHAKAIAALDPDEAEAVLLDVLTKSEHEIDAASALVRLATGRTAGGLFSHKARDYCLIWEARAGRRPPEFDEERSRRYALAIKERISVLLEQRATSTKPAAFDYKLIELANFLAALGGNDSSEQVWQVISLPVKFFAWRRVEALENLLFGGTILPASTTLNILDPIIESIYEEPWLYNNQGSWLLMRCLCLLLFIDTPATGIDRVRQIVFGKDFPRYELRELMSALGCSRHPEALNLLREIASTEGGGLENITVEWIEAVASLRTPEAAHFLLSFIETGVDGFESAIDLKSHHGDLLASHIVNIANENPAVKQRIFQLCSEQCSPDKRALLSKVIAQLGTTEALLAGLNLIDDTIASNHTATAPVPYDLSNAIENAFIEQRPHGKTGTRYTLVPRSANVIRAKLFDMVLKDDRRRLSAFSLLGQIEVWRLEYERPSTEPRHPVFDSGELWPPLALPRVAGPRPGFTIDNTSPAANTSSQELSGISTHDRSVIPQSPKSRSDVLLVTVNDHEFEAIYNIARARLGTDLLPIHLKRTYYDLGDIGGARVGLVRSEMGSGEPGGAAMTTLQAMHDLEPRHIIAVGIMFGIDPDTQKIGHILYSKQLQSYELMKMGTDKDSGDLKIISRGDKVTANPRFLNRVRDAADHWQEGRDEGKPEAVLMLSGDKLVDNIDFRNQLLDLYPEAKGGEMEASGIYSASREEEVPWMVIKAICDYADGEKSKDKEERQRLAAGRAARFVFFLLERGGLS